MEMFVSRGFDMLMFSLFVCLFYFVSFLSQGKFEHLVITPRYETYVSRKLAWRSLLCFFEISGVWGLVITKGLTAD